MTATLLNIPRVPDRWERLPISAAARTAIKKAMQASPAWAETWGRHSRAYQIDASGMTRPHLLALADQLGIDAERVAFEADHAEPTTTTEPVSEPTRNADPSPVMVRALNKQIATQEPAPMIQTATDRQKAALALAEQIAALAGAQPVDAETVREIVAEETAARFDHMAEHMVARVADVAKDMRDALSERIAAEVKAALPITRIEIKTPAERRNLSGLFHEQFPTLFQTVAAGVHAALIGPKGTGKSHAARQVAEALGRPFVIVQQVTSPSKLFGWQDGSGTYHTTPFREAWERGAVCVAEEFDAWDSQSTVAINDALESGLCAFPDSPYPIQAHPDFVMVANGNTWRGATREYTGRNQLDGASQDRFAFIAWQIDERMERAAAGHDAWCDRVQSIRAAMIAQNVKQIPSPRATLKGARLLGAGLAVETVDALTIWLDMAPATVEQIKKNATPYRAPIRAAA